MEVLSDKLRKASFRYNPDLIGGMIASNRRRYGRVRQETKMIVFMMTKRVVLRGAIAFSNINRNRGRDTFYEFEDIINDLYIVMDRCMDKFDPAKGGNFYMYFNRAVNNRIRRIANYKYVVSEDSFSKKFAEGFDGKYDLDQDEVEDVLATEYEDFNGALFDMDMENMGFGDEQYRVVQAMQRMAGKKDMSKDLGMSIQRINEVIEEVGDIMKERWI